MDTFFAAAVTLAIIAILAAFLERHHRHDVAPHAPLGADPASDPDLYRVMHDLAGHRD